MVENSKRGLIVLDRQYKLLKVMTYFMLIIYTKGVNFHIEIGIVTIQFLIDLVKMTLY